MSGGWVSLEIYDCCNCGARVECRYDGSEHWQDRAMQRGADVYCGSCADSACASRGPGDA